MKAPDVLTRGSKLPRVGTTIFTHISQLAAKAGAINLGQGFPDFGVPAPLLEGLAEAAAAGHHQYAPMTGIAPLRQAIAQKTADCYGAVVDPDVEVTVTSGATEAIFAAIHAVVRPGDEVIVFDPCYDCYEPAVDLTGGRCVHLPLLEPGFGIPWQQLEDAIGPATRMIIINSPHNPTGAVISTDDLDRLAALIRERAITVISDEVYEHIIFDDAPHASVVAHEELRARSFVVSSFGKTYHCTGWKVGYCIAPPALSAEFRKVHQYLTFCTFHPAQWALAQMITEHPAHYRELPAFYEAKRDAFAELLAPSRFGVLPVAGSYFQLIDYRDVSDMPDLEFCEWLTTTHGVAAIPLSPFYGNPDPNQRLARLCFAKSEATLATAAARLADV